MNPYFTAPDTEKFRFYRIPKLLFTDERYRPVSTDAKMLYCWTAYPCPRKTAGKTSVAGSTNISPSVRRRSYCTSATKRSAVCLQSWKQPTSSSVAVRDRAGPTAST